VISLAALAVFSGLSLNLLLQFAVGASGAAADIRSRRSVPFFQLLLMFIAILFLWLLFSAFLPPHWRGFSEYFLIFPFSALTCFVLERLLEKLITKSGNRMWKALTGYDALVPVSVLITLNMAGSFRHAFILALFFVLGNLAAILVLNEIRRKSSLERVPASLRGSPLVLISMGLLSLISAVAAGICFKILDIF